MLRAVHRSATRGGHHVRGTVGFPRTPGRLSRPSVFEGPLPGGRGLRPRPFACGGMRHRLRAGQRATSRAGRCSRLGPSGKLRLNCSAGKGHKPSTCGYSRQPPRATAIKPQFCRARGRDGPPCPNRGRYRASRTRRINPFTYAQRLSRIVTSARTSAQRCARVSHPLGEEQR